MISTKTGVYKLIKIIVLLIVAIMFFFWTYMRAEQQWIEDIIVAVKEDDTEKVERLFEKTHLGLSFEINREQSQPFPLNLFTELGLDTPLNYACESASVEMVKLLIEKGTDVNYTPKGHFTPLEVTIMSFDERENYHDVEDIIQLLIENGLDSKMIMNHGEHPCEVVLEIPPFTNQKYDEQKEKEILEIYKKLYDWSDIEPKESSFLWASTGFSHFEIMDYMLGKQDIFVNSRDEEGQTALFNVCVPETKWEVEEAKTSVSILRKYGIDESIRDNLGKTALDYAKESGNQKWIEILE